MNHLMGWLLSCRPGQLAGVEHILSAGRKTIGIVGFLHLRSLMAHHSIEVPGGADSAQHCWIATERLGNPEAGRSSWGGECFGRFDRRKGSTLDDPVGTFPGTGRSRKGEGPCDSPRIPRASGSGSSRSQPCGSIDGGVDSRTPRAGGRGKVMNQELAGTVHFSSLMRSVLNSTTSLWSWKTICPFGSLLKRGQPANLDFASNSFQ